MISFYAETTVNIHRIQYANELRILQHFWLCIIISFSMCQLFYSFWLQGKDLILKFKKLFLKYDLEQKSTLRISCLQRFQFLVHECCCSQICWSCNNSKVQTNKKPISIQKKRSRLCKYYFQSVVGIFSFNFLSS